MLMIVHPLKLEYRHNAGTHTSEWTFHSEEQLLEVVAEIAELLNAKLEIKPHIVEPTGTCESCKQPIYPPIEDMLAGDTKTTDEPQSRRE